MDDGAPLQPADAAEPTAAHANGSPARNLASPDAPGRAELERQLSELSLPVMWSLRQAAVRAFEPLDMRPTRVLLLELIARGFTHPKELADMLDTLPPAVSNMLTDLESRDAIARSPDPEDGRRIRLALTPDGEALLDEIRRRWIELSHARLAVLTDEELAQLVATYRKLLRQEDVP